MSNTHQNLFFCLSCKVEAKFSLENFWGSGHVYSGIIQQRLPCVLTATQVCFYFKARAQMCLVCVGPCWFPVSKISTNHTVLLLGFRISRSSRTHLIPCSLFFRNLLPILWLSYLQYFRICFLNFTQENNCSNKDENLGF